MLESELLHGKLSRADHFVVVSAQLYNNSYISCIDHGHDFKSYCHIRVQDIIASVHEWRCYGGTHLFINVILLINLPKNQIISIFLIFCDEHLDYIRLAFHFY